MARFSTTMANYGLGLHTRLVYTTSTRLLFAITTRLHTLRLSTSRYMLTSIMMVVSVIISLALSSVKLQSLTSHTTMTMMRTQMMRTRVMRTKASVIVALGKRSCLSKFSSKVCSLSASFWISRKNLIEAIVREQTHKSRHSQTINYGLSIICTLQPTQVGSVNAQIKRVVRLTRLTSQCPPFATSI